MQTVVELPEFQRRCSALFLDEERQEIVNYLAANPEAGKVLKDTGGIRKLRWAKGNKGKSGGARVVYYYHNELIPLFLLSVFGKNQKENLSKAERNALAKLTKTIGDYYGV